MRACAVHVNMAGAHTPHHLRAAHTHHHSVWPCLVWGVCPHAGLAWEFHTRARAAFQEGGELLGVFELAVRTLAQLGARAFPYCVRPF